MGQLQKNPSHSTNQLKWTRILKVLADECRLQIICELLKQESSVQDLSNVLDTKLYNISKHLKILETSGLVQKRKAGIKRIYYITDEFGSRLTNNNEVLDLGCCKFIFKDFSV